MNATQTKNIFGNILEHGLTRFGDIAATLLLLLLVNPEFFGILSLIQAWVVPVLFFFVGFEINFFKHYSKIKNLDQKTLTQELWRYRGLAWVKLLVIPVLSLVFTRFYPNSTQLPWSDLFWTFFWALLLPVSSQISGSDREFLRMELAFRELNMTVVWQKITLILGTLLALWIYPSQVFPLAMAVLFSTLSTAGLSLIYVKKRIFLRNLNAISIEAQFSWSLFWKDVFSFGFWRYLMGVGSSWATSLELWVLGFILISEYRTPGLFGTVNKLANFSLALPYALANSYEVSLGREELGPQHEKNYSKRFLARVLAIQLIQAIVILAMAPSVLALLSRGRWSEPEQLQMLDWLKWMVLARMAFTPGWMMSQWLMLKRSAPLIFASVIVPWLGLSALIYYGVAVGKWWDLGGLTVYDQLVRIQMGMGFILMMFASFHFIKRPHEVH